MKKIFFVIILLLFLASPIFAQRQNIHFDHLSTEKGLSSNRIKCTLQDQRGFMWFGTSNGLNKYNGYTFTVYTDDSTVSPYLTQHSILSLCEDQTGRLWVGTWDGLNTFDLKKDKIFHFKHNPDKPHSLAGNWIKCIYKDSRGNIWIGTKDNGLSYLDRSFIIAGNIDTCYAFVNYTYNHNDTTSLAANNINSICEDSLGYIWIGTHGAGLNRFDPVRKKFKRFNYLKNKGIFDPLIRKIWRDPDSNQNILWIATQHTFNQFDATHNKVVTYPYDRYIHEGFIAIQKMNEHTFWLGSQGRGIYIFDKNKGSFTRLQGQAYNPGRTRHTWINDLYKDKNGRMWVATYGGIYKYDRFAHKFPLYQIEVDSPEGKRICEINDIIEDRTPGTPLLYLATPENGIVRFNRETGETILLGGQDTKIRYLGLLQDPDQLQFLWTATWGAALLKGNLETGNTEPYSFHDDFSKLDVRTLRTFYNNEFSRQVIKDLRGYIWQASLGGLFKINPQTKKFTAYLPDDKNSESISGRNVTTILEDRFGLIWVGTFDNGLNILDPETECFTHYKHNPNDVRSLNQNYISVIFEDHSGVFYVGTDEMLHRFDREQNCFIRYQEFPGSIKSILEDESGNLWVGTTKGLSKFNPILKTIRNYDKNDGLQGNQFNSRAAFKGEKGRLYFGGPKGFNAFYPDDILDNPQVSPVVFTDFQIFNKSVKPGKHSPLQSIIAETKEIVLNHDQSVFSIEFAALNYSAPMKNKYAYKMEGIDPDWVYTNASRRFATYTNLDPGAYTFCVKGSNNDGIWNEEGASVKIIILPPWWATWWAYSAYFIVAAALILGIFRFEIKRRETEHRATVAELQAKTAEAQKEAEKEQMRSRIASDLHDEIGGNLSSISMIGQALEKRLKLPGHEKERLRKIPHIARITAESMRDIVWFVNPANDSLEKLLAKMRETANLMLEGMDVDFNFDVDKSSFNNDLNFRRNLFLLYKEILQNIVRHAKASQVIIKLDQNEKQFTLSVKDNGIGFNTKTEFKGNGLKNFQHRAEEMNGEIVVSSEPDMGTQVKLSVKIP